MYWNASLVLHCECTFHCGWLFKKFENRLIFDEVMNLRNLWDYILWTRWTSCWYVYWQKLSKLKQARNIRMTAFTCSRNIRQYKTHNSTCYGIVKYTRNSLDCDQSNVYSSRVVFWAISQDLLFRSFSVYRRSASDHPL